jgi:L-arabinose isomerase
MKVMNVGQMGGVASWKTTPITSAKPVTKFSGAHVEICESIAVSKPKLEIHPLGIGGRLIRFDRSLTYDRHRRAPPSWTWVDAIASLPMLLMLSRPTNRFRNFLWRALWLLRPNSCVAAATWIFAGGGTSYWAQLLVTPEHLRDYAEMAGIEFLLIDENTTVEGFKDTLRWNDLYYHLNKGL